MAVGFICAVSWRGAASLVLLLLCMLESLQDIFHLLKGSQDSFAYEMA